ncbi:hypothetical protein MUK42_33450 [Musa troglodytarum]|uniref:Uncharacterized protein n=1 Tax=Musa troglodytarum TaxID=320322 RepID=A0A9E7HKM1_9LILI|nr:hypothetical protein MUK42_33450 [Musa troglodytarum]
MRAITGSKRLVAMGFGAVAAAKVVHVSFVADTFAVSIQIPRKLRITMHVPTVLNAAPQVLCRPAVTGRRIGEHSCRCSGIPPRSFFLHHVVKAPMGSEVAA